MRRQGTPKGEDYGGKIWEKMRDDKARKVASCSPSCPIQSPTNCFDVERSTSDNVDAFVTAAVSFAWRNSSVLDIEVGQRNPAVVVAGGDLAPGRPSMEDVDSTRAWEIPVGDVVESDARGRTGGGPIEPDCSCRFYGRGRWGPYYQLC